MLIPQHCLLTCSAGLVSKCTFAFDVWARPRGQIWLTIIACNWRGARNAWYCRHCFYLRLSLILALIQQLCDRLYSFHFRAEPFPFCCLLAKQQWKLAKTPIASYLWRERSCLLGYGRQTAPCNNDYTIIRRLVIYAGIPTSRSFSLRWELPAEREKYQRSSTW